MVRKQELDQGETPLDRLARHPDRCQGAKKPELLALAQA
jgi:hypothetical protein